MRDFSAYISHGKIRRLVRFPKPPKARPSSYDFRPTPSHSEAPHGRRTIIVEHLPVPAPPLPALPMPRREVQDVLGKISKPDGEYGCWLWPEDCLDKSGYGVQRWAYADPDKPKNNRPAHQVVWEIYNGRWFPIDKDGRSYEFDHRRSCPRRCVNPYHGEPVPKRINILRMHRTRGHATAAD